MPNFSFKTFTRLLMAGAVGYAGGVSLQPSLEAGASCEDDECQLGIWCDDNPNGDTSCNVTGFLKCETRDCC